jgi:hypothetical protein
VTFDRQLAVLGAPFDIVEWARGYPDLATAWATAERGDCLLWIAAATARSDDARRAVVRAATACARLACDAVPRDELTFRPAINAAEAWAIGALSREAVEQASARVAEAVIRHRADERLWAAASAAWAAAWAALWLEYDDARRMTGVQAARHAAEAAAMAAGPDAHAQVLAQCAAVVRELVACPSLPE